MPRTTKLWKELLPAEFPDQNNLKIFKKRAYSLLKDRQRSWDASGIAGVVVVGSGNRLPSVDWIFSFNVIIGKTTILIVYVRHLKKYSVAWSKDMNRKHYKIFNSYFE